MTLDHEPVTIAKEAGSETLLFWNPMRDQAFRTELLKNLSCADAPDRRLGKLLKGLVRCAGRCVECLAVPWDSRAMDAGRYLPAVPPRYAVLRNPQRASMLLDTAFFG
jgi:hypothetical protein